MPNNKFLSYERGIVMLKDLVKKCRSYRRFFQEVSIPYEDLKDMVDTARLTGCTKNCQGLSLS